MAGSLPHRTVATNQLYHSDALLSRHFRRFRGNRRGGNLRDVQQLRRRLVDVRRDASRNMVWQNGQAVPTTSAPVATSSSRAFHVDALAGFFAQEHQSAAGAAAEGAFARARRIHDFRRSGPITCARLVVDAAVAAQVAGIVINDLSPLWRRRGSRRVSAPAIRCDARSRRRRRTPSNPSPMVRTQCGQIETIFFTLAACSVSMFASASCWKTRSLPRRRAGSPVHFSLLQDAELVPRCRITRAKRQHDLAPLRIVRAHAAEPQAVFLRAVEDRKFLFLDEFSRSLAAKAERVAVALEVQKQFGAVVVFPLARVHRAAAQADDDRQVLDADGTLVFARAARGALKDGVLRNDASRAAALRSRCRIRSGNREGPARFLWVEFFAGVVGGTVFGAAAALDARIGLQRDDLRDVFAGVQTEIFVAGERRNLAEAAAPQKNRSGLRTRCRCLVCGISGRKMAASSVWSPPVDAARRSSLRSQPHAGQIGDHQKKISSAMTPDSRRDLAQPARAHDETADDESGDRDRDSDGEHGGETRNRTSERSSRATGSASRSRRRGGSS